MLNYMSWTVYRHITPNGKSYIGITCRKPEDRWNNGRGYKDTLFGKAIEKYKWENIKHEILDTNLTEYEAKCLEEYYIFSYQTYVGFKDCKGYNCTLGGEGTVGFQSWNKGKHISEEHKIKISEKLKGKQPSEETRRRISESNKGKPAWNKGLPSQRKGIPQSEDAKRKNSESHKGQTPWNKGKTGVQVAWNKGIPQSEDAKRKNSESHKGKTSPNKGKPMSEDAKRKNRDSHKGMHRVYNEDGTFHMER